jgi:hypothetical protein
MNSNLAVVRNRKVATLSGPVVPVLVAASGTDTAMRVLNFFATQIENDNTRAAWSATKSARPTRCSGSAKVVLAPRRVA